MIIGLDRVRATDIPLVGGKGANLGELIAAGLPVPGGFCVTAEAYRSAMTPLREEIAGLLEAGNHDRLRELVAAAPLPDGLADRIRAAAGDLDGPVAVRSSATAEDLPDASFAGQQETYLGVTAPETTTSPSPQADSITTRLRPVTGSRVNATPAASAGIMRCTTTARATSSWVNPCSSR